MRIGVTAVDQDLARLDVELAKRLGESVDPRVTLIAQADLSGEGQRVLPASSNGTSHRHLAWLDTETGEVVGYGSSPPITP